jgi:hypothetical protein
MRIGRRIRRVVRAARLCPYCGLINEPTVLVEHTVSCRRPPEYDAEIERQQDRFALWVAILFAAPIAIALVMLVGRSL